MIPLICTSDHSSSNRSTRIQKTDSNEKVSNEVTDCQIHMCAVLNRTVISSKQTQNKNVK